MSTLGATTDNGTALNASTTRLLRPGVPILNRSSGVLQVGLDAPVATVADEPGVRRLLRALTGPGGAQQPAEPLSPEALAWEKLDRAGLLTALPSSEEQRDPRFSTLRAQFGPDAARRRSVRAATKVVVRCDPSVHAVLHALLGRAGLDVLDDLQAVEPAPAHLIVTNGVLDRSWIDPLIRDSTPHLVVSGSAAGRRLGPFVVPGRTACVRCVDAHESLRDPRRPLLLAQAAIQGGHGAAPTDPLLDQMALAWAVRDLVRYVEGDEPSTWSTTYDITPAHAPLATSWGRHPDCGCAWDVFTEFP